jgi:acetoacetyl-CoA synthetase
VIDPIWVPSKSRIERSNMMRFITTLQKQFPEIKNYQDLYQWSINNPENFWEAIWKFCGVKYKNSYDKVLVDGDKLPGAKWFVGSKINFVENLLQADDAQLAIIGRSERSQRSTLNFKQLRNKVARMSHALIESGVKPGDRVAGYLPNIPETVISMLAATAVGAVWSSCSEDFGVKGVLDRFGQIEPAILIAADGYSYQGKKIRRIDSIATLSHSIASIKKVVVIPFLELDPDLTNINNSISFDHFIDNQFDTIPYVYVDFDHPLFILYSSGTTGKPKCIVHGCGGTFMQLIKEHMLHIDVTQSDVVFYFTTCGWMMWNWLVAALATGATIVTYDGSPFYPANTQLFDVTDQEGITVFGTSAKYLAAIQKEKLVPMQSHRLTELKAILSTGSPLMPEQFDYVYENIKTDVQLSSISGGTDIVSCFQIGNPILPVYRGELQCRGLGLSIEVFNDDGESVVNEKGELVCTKPFPSIPIYFWDDEDNIKFNQAYFSKFPNTWAHSDYAELTDRGTMIIYGRSDAVLNPGGVRIGTAEIYREVEKFHDVLESIVVGQEWEGDTRIVLFVKLRNGVELNTELKNEIKQLIRNNTSPRHVPAKIIQVDDVPRTISGKIVELAVCNVIHDRPIKNVDALANPEALENFRNLSDLR